MPPSFTIEQVTERTLENTKSFLLGYEDSSMFLLGNLEAHGFTLTDAANSGNFRIVKNGERIVGVFCLTRRGNLLVQSEVADLIFEQVLSACSDDRLQIKGVLSEWDFAHKFWLCLRKKKIIQKENFMSKEVLYSLKLDGKSSRPDQKVRLLQESDFEQWKPLRLAYHVEEKIPNDLNEQQLRESYMDLVRSKTAWGYFLLGGELVSMGNLNAKAVGLGQIGGVFTTLRSRRKGFSKQTMLKLIEDSQSSHSIRKLLLFTGERNVAAQRLYQSLGFKRIGHYALLFGE
jgi:ribosomal protein S18 acetylase RimI-like enzyme